MQAFILDYYFTFKAFHIIAVIAWMAGLFYLPRLYVYHAEAPAGSALSETFKVMERKLLRIIMNPAMIAVWVLGVLLIFANTGLMKAGWMHGKLALVIMMSIFHMMLARYRKQFLHDKNTRPAKFYRYLNEVPTVLMVLIVMLAVIKPF